MEFIINNLVAKHSVGLKRSFGGKSRANKRYSQLLPPKHSFFMSVVYYRTASARSTTA